MARRASQLAPSLTAGITGPLASAKGTPLEPIGAALVARDRRRGAQFRRRRIAAHGQSPRRRRGADRAAPARDRASGAAINVSGGDGVTYYWPSGRMRVDGDIAMQGGGLPTARIALRQPRSGGPMSGTALIAPYAAGGARIALAPVRFAARRDGWTQVSTIVLLDGPFGGGRVTGLRIPIDGRFGAGGALVFGQGCIDARFAALQIGALRLGPTRLPLVPDRPGDPFPPRRGPGPVRGRRRATSRCAAGSASRRSRSMRRARGCSGSASSRRAGWRFASASPMRRC